MEDLIIRLKYRQKIAPFIDKQLIKALTGQRRTGKSYILRQIELDIKAANPQAHFIFINKEDIAFDAIRTASDLYDYVRTHTKESTKNYVFIDEIQEIQQFEKAMRTLLLDSKYDLYCTGSNAKMLSGELATTLSGRYVDVYIGSLSYIEFLEFHQLENNMVSLQKYFRYGGLPYLKNLPLTDEVAFEYLNGVYNTILYRDVVTRHELRNTAFLENLIRFLADNTGHLFSSKKISNYLQSQHIKIATSQVINYLSYLADSYLIHRAGRFDITGKRLFEFGEKIYFEDIGLRNVAFEYKQTDIGKIMENAVYKHLLFNDYEVKVGQIGHNEIDFVAKRKNEYLYIQVCYLLHTQETIEREFGNLGKINDNYPKIVVSMDEFSGNTYNGIQHIHLRDFLTMNL